MEKKAILVVSFGTTYDVARKNNIESIEHRIQKAFPDYEIRRAFTSRRIIKILAERDGIIVDTEEKALEKLQKENYRHVLVQPLHIVAGAEYDKIKRIVSRYAHQPAKSFDLLRLGRPLLYYTGSQATPDDYQRVIEALQTQINPLNSQEAAVFMGHGGVHPANTAYAALQLKFQAAKLDKFFVYTIEGFPELCTVIAQLKGKNIKKVYLVPFLLTAGDHVHKDMAGSDEDSAKSLLIKAGFEVSVQLKALGENTAIQDLYISHIKDLLDPSYRVHR